MGKMSDKLKEAMEQEEPWQIQKTYDKVAAQYPPIDDMEPTTVIVERIMSSPSMNRLLWTKDDIRNLLTDVINEYRR